MFGTIHRKAGEWSGIESVIDCYVGDYNVRLWIEKKHLPYNHDRERAFHRRLLSLRGDEYTVYGLVNKIVDLIPRGLDVVSVQVKDGAVGTRVYVRDFITIEENGSN